MYCPNCGAENLDDFAFCQNCGKSLHDERNVPPKNTSSFRPAPENRAFADSYLGVLKTLGSSPLFLIAAVSYTISVFLSIVSSVIGINFGMLTYQLYELADELGLERYLAQAVSQGMQAGSVVGAIGSAIPAILLTVGIWMIYASCSDRYDPYVKTGGLTMIKVLRILKLIAYSLLTFVTVPILLLLTFTANRYFIEIDFAEGGIVTALLGILTGILAAVFALQIVYNALLLRTVNRIKRSAVSGSFCGFASGFVGVMSMIGGVFTLFGAISGFVFGGIFSGLGSIASGLASLCFGLLIFRYNKTFRTNGASIGTVVSDTKAQPSISADGNENGFDSHTPLL